jgi:transcriptional regulator with XRE-family HTH domain
MKLSELKTNEQLIAEQLRDDPEFRAKWERTALARAVALKVITYRSQNGVTQRQLADRLGMKQPQVARLERGDVTPEIETLRRLAAKLGMEFVLDVRPIDREPKLVTKRAQNRDVVASYESDDVAVLLAAV